MNLRERNFIKYLQALALNPCQHVKNLGVIFDAEYSFEPNIRNIHKMASHHFKNIARVKMFLVQAKTETKKCMLLLPAELIFVMLFFLVLRRNTSQLQLHLQQISAAHMLMRTRERAH